MTPSTEQPPPVALITGAASGIGRAAAELFSARGARVVLADRDEAGERVAATLRAGGRDAAFARCDVARPGDVRDLVAQALSRYGRLDWAFNNAGTEGVSARVEDIAPEDWDRTIAVNLTGVWHCMREEIPAMRRSGGGSIVNCSSIAGLCGFATAGAYTASKHAVVGLTRAAALECAAEGIRVNALCPGVIETPMVTRATHGDADAAAALVAGEPMGRMGTPEEVAEAALWLCGAGAGFVTGAALAVDGGWTAR